MLSPAEENWMEDPESFYIYTRLSKSPERFIKLDTLVLSGLERVRSLELIREYVHLWKGEQQTLELSYDWTPEGVVWWRANYYKYLWGDAFEPQSWPAYDPALDNSNYDLLIANLCYAAKNV